MAARLLGENELRVTIVTADSFSVERIDDGAYWLQVIGYTRTVDEMGTVVYRKVGK